MQTKVIKNADARAELFQELQTNYADKVCLPSGRGRLHSCSSTQRCRGCLQRKCRQSLSTVFGGFFADKVCLQSLSTGLVCTIWECRQSLSTGLKSLSKAFCKVVCGNADKVCLEITSFSLFKYSIIEFSERKSSHPHLAIPATSARGAAAWLELTCTAENVLLCVRACHSSYAPVPFKSCVRACERASRCASERACVRAFERQRAAASSEQRAASSEQQRACIAPLLFRVWEQN